jgi:hypothetical protein
LEQTLSFSPFATVALIIVGALGFSFPWSYALALMARKLLGFWATWVSCFNAYWIATLLPIAVIAGAAILIGLSVIEERPDALNASLPSVGLFIVMTMVAGVGAFLAAGMIFGRMIKDDEGRQLGVGRGLMLAAAQTGSGFVVFGLYLGITGMLGR